MEEIFTTLLWIGAGVPEAIMHDLLFPTDSRSVEEKVVENARRSKATIQNQHDRLIYHVRTDKEKSDVIRYQADLLQKKDKEIRDLKARIRSLERENSDLRSRSKRRR